MLMSQPDQARTHAMEGNKTHHGIDVTEYARSRGYQGDNTVLVHQGRVVSHRSVRWEYFIKKAQAGRI